MSHHLWLQDNISKFNRHENVKSELTSVQEELKKKEAELAETVYKLKEVEGMLKYKAEEPNDPKYLEQIRNSNEVFDVVYNVFYHQDVAFVNDHIRNTFKFNKNNKYLIIAHLNDNLYKNHKELLRLNLIINPVFYDKKIFSWQLTVARLENYQYLKNNGIKFNHMMLTVGTGRFIRQVPYYPPWKKNTLNKRPKYGHRVSIRYTKCGHAITHAIENTVKNKFTAKEQDYNNQVTMKNTVGIPAWFTIRDKNFKNKYIVPFFKEKGIFVSIELLNTWLCSMDMMEEINKWFYNDGMFSFYKKQDPVCREQFPLDELLFPTLSRHFDYYYSFTHNNVTHCCFPQKGGRVFKLNPHENFWGSKHNNTEWIKQHTKDESWYMYKKFSRPNPNYYTIHNDLELIYEIDDNELLKFNNEKCNFESDERKRLAKYGLFPGQICKTPGCSYLANTSDNYLVTKKKRCQQKFIGLCCQKCNEGSHGHLCTKNICYPDPHEELLKLENIVRRQKLELSSVTIIQRVFRGHIGRKANAKRWALFRAEMGVMNALLNSTGIYIQRSYRDYLAKKIKNRFIN